MEIVCRTSGYVVVVVLALAVTTGVKLSTVESLNMGNHCCVLPSPQGRTMAKNEPYIRPGDGDETLELPHISDREGKVEFGRLKYDFCTDT